MGYIEKSLIKDENVIYQAKLHWIIFLWPIIGSILLVFLLGAGVFSGFGFNPPPTGAMPPGGAQTFLQFAPIIFILTIITGINSLINYRSSEFAVTNKRVLGKFGFIRRKSIEIYLTKVEGIQVEQGILDRLLDSGSIIISGTGGLKNPFKNISNPLEFRQNVQNQVSKVD